MLMFKPLTNEDIKERIFPKIEKAVTDLDGSIKVKDTIGKRLLAYDIDGNKEGYYVLCNLTLSSVNISKLKEKLNLTTEVLRFLNIKNSEL